jgi:hypothetical protein
MSYTEELTQLIVDEYSADPTRETVDRLAEEHGKSTRSIIAKLSSAGVYQAPPRVSKSGEPITRKEDLVKEIGEWFGIEVPSLSKAGKLDLQRLYKALSNPDYIRAHLVDLEDEAA